MSAVQGRERRATAGQRITFLAGQELENDEAFWGHDTWAEDSESFHSSDAENDENAVDEFDSDFDESESDHEEEEDAMGAAEERQIALEERDTKKRQVGSSAYTDTKKHKGKAVAAATEKKGRWSKGKRIMGNGLNAGIVLNVPLAYQQVQAAAAIAPAAPLAQTLPSTLAQSPDALLPIRNGSAPVAITHEMPVIPTTTQSAATITQPLVPAGTIVSAVAPVGRKKPSVGLAASRARRTEVRMAQESIDAINPSRVVSLDKTTTTEGEAAVTAVARKVKRSFTQAELLLEAVVDTEPENKRWLLGRKRRQAEKDETESMLRGDNKSGEVIEKFVSRRGYLNTILFPSMDHIPPILRATTASLVEGSATTTPTVAAADQLADRPSTSTPPQSRTLCVITGKVARYRDPLTGQGYHDTASFRELRRRHDAAQAKTRNDNGAAARKPAVAPNVKAIRSEESNGNPMPLANATVAVAKTPPPKKARAKSKPAEKPKKSPATKTPKVSSRVVDAGAVSMGTTAAVVSTVTTVTASALPLVSTAPSQPLIPLVATDTPVPNTTALEHVPVTHLLPAPPHSASPPSPGRRSDRKRTLTTRMRETLASGLLSPKGPSTPSHAVVGAAITAHTVATAVPTTPKN